MCTFQPRSGRYIDRQGRSVPPWRATRKASSPIKERHSAADFSVRLIVKIRLSNHVLSGAVRDFMPRDAAVATKDTRGIHFDRHGQK